MMMIKILIVAVLLAILASLGKGLYHLVHDKGESKRLANTLTIRIVLSVLLVILIGVAYFSGAIQPHAVVPSQ